MAGWTLIAGWRGIAAGAAAGALVAGLAVGVGQGWRHGAEMATVQAAHARDLQAYADAAAYAARRQMEQQQAHQKTVAAIDARHTQELTNATDEIDRLRADVVAGKRLRVNAQCPSPAAGVPAASGTAGLDDAAGPRLTDAAERDYFALRERVARSDAMIKGLQEYVGDVCLAR